LGLTGLLASVVGCRGDTADDGCTPERPSSSHHVGFSPLGLFDDLGLAVINRGAYATGRGSVTSTVLCLFTLHRLDACCIARSG
jgi:hypothetical protein